MNFKSPFNIEISGLTWINTPQGIMLADKLSKYNKLFSPEDNQEVSNVLSNSSKDLLDIVLKNGNNIAVDPKTTFLTTKGWKSAEDLTNQDYILNKMVIFSHEKGHQNIPYKQNLKTNAMPIHVPSKMSVEFAEWLGMICSIGRYNSKNGHVSIYSTDEKVIEKFEILTLQLFKLKPVVFEEKNRIRKKEYYIISQNVVEFLKTWIGPNPMWRRVPIFLMEGSTQEHLAFISGLGSAAKLDYKGNVLIYQGVSKALADFTTVVLRNAGYIVSLQSIKRDYNYYIVRISSKHPQSLKINLINDELENKISMDLNYMVAIDDSLLNKNVPYYHPMYNSLYKAKKTTHKIISYQIMKELIPDYKLDYYFIKVSKINKVKSKTVLIKTLYDNSLLVNNIIVGGFY